MFVVWGGEEEGVWGLLMARPGMGIDAAIGHLKSQLGMLGSSSEATVPPIRSFTHGTLPTQYVRHKPPFKIRPIVPASPIRTKI